MFWRSAVFNWRPPTGYDKDSEFDAFADAFRGRVKVLILLGKTAAKIEAAANKAGFSACYTVNSLEAAVKKCHELAEPGDCVLLSPACASWDMFKNFEERGQLFKTSVMELKRH